jgi:hypothetical protein
VDTPPGKTEYDHSGEKSCNVEYAVCPAQDSNQSTESELPMYMQGILQAPACSLQAPTPLPECAVGSVESNRQRVEVGRVPTPLENDLLVGSDPAVYIELVESSKWSFLFTA